MSVVFNAKEVLEMAKQIERNGAAFYRKAAGRSAKHSKLLLEIADQEDEHYLVFEEMQARLSGRETEDTAFDPDNAAVLYLKALADGKVFDESFQDAGALAGDASLERIIQKAIGMEKESIVFYSAMREMVPARLGGAKLTDIIKEEFSHIRWLADKGRKLAGKSGK